MMYFAVITFLVLAWMREHGKAMWLEQMCKRYIADNQELKSKVSARVEPVAPVKVPPLCAMCRNVMTNGTGCGWLERPNGKKYVPVCHSCKMEFHSLMRSK
jgi:hypothetical protein